jgi:hypothetical protein
MATVDEPMETRTAASSHANKRGDICEFNATQP